MSAPPIHNNHYAVLNPAIVSFQEAKKLEKTISLFDGFLLALLKSINQSLQLRKNTLLAIDQQEALELMASFDEEYNNAMVEAEQFIVDFDGKEEDAIDTEMTLLARQLLSTHHLILSIAEGVEVDEDSMEYGNFIADMATKAAAENKPAYGRTALFNLFND